MIYSFIYIILIKHIETVFIDDYAKLFALNRTLNGHVTIISKVSEFNIRETVNGRWVDCDFMKIQQLYKRCDPLIVITICTLEYIDPGVMNDYQLHSYTSKLKNIFTPYNYESFDKQLKEFTKDTEMVKQYYCMDPVMQDIYKSDWLYQTESSPIVRSDDDFDKFNNMYIVHGAVYITNKFTVAIRGQKIVVNFKPYFVSREVFELWVQYKHSYVRGVMVIYHSYECQDFYYGNECWHFCAVSPRGNCTTEGEFICHRGWLRMRIEVTIWLYDPKFENRIPKFKRHSRSCQLLDICYVHRCYKENETCMPSGNTSFLCVLIQPVYTMDLFPNLDNISFQYFIAEESITCNYDQSFENQGFANITKVYWEIPEAIQKYLSTNGTKISFTKSSRTFTYQVACVFLLFEYFAIKFWRNLTYQFPPSRIWFSNLSLGYDQVVYTHQTIHCECNHICNGENIDFTLYIYPDVETNIPAEKYSFNKFPEIKMPSYLSLGFIRLQCDIKWIFYKNSRPPFLVSFNRTIILNDFIKFDFSTTRDDFRPLDTIHCQDLSFLKSSKTISQILGNSQLTIDNSLGLITIPSNIIGGHYGVRCTLDITDTTGMRIIKYRSYYRNLVFDVSRPPTFVCFNRFPQVNGGTIFCSHNGYPPAYTIVEIKMSSLNNREIISISNARSIRVPYTSDFNEFRVVCTVNYSGDPLDIDKFNPNDSTSDTTSLTFILYDDIYKRYSLMPEDQLCNQLAPYEYGVEETLEIFQNGEFSFHVSVFYFTFSQATNSFSNYSIDNSNNTDHNNIPSDSNKVPVRISSYVYGTNPMTLFITANTGLFALNIVILTRIAIIVRQPSSLLRVSRFRLSYVRKTHIHAILNIFAHDLCLDEFAKRSVHETDSEAASRKKSSRYFSYYYTKNPFEKQQSSIRSFSS